MFSTRIRPDKQIQAAPGEGYTLRSDGNGDFQIIPFPASLPVATAESPDITFTGNGTPASPLSATITDAARAALRGYRHWTDEFTDISGGNTVQLTNTPLFPFPLHTYRNGLRQQAKLGWQYDPANPRTIILPGAPLDPRDTIIVDYVTLDRAEQAAG